MKYIRTKDRMIKELLTEDKGMPLPIDKPIPTDEQCQTYMWAKLTKETIERNYYLNQAIEYAKKDGFYGKDKKGNIKSYTFDHYAQDISPLLGLLVATDGAKFLNIDYGTTWALTEKELENK